MLKRTVTSLIATSISSVLAVDIQTAPPPDGIVPFGINSELAPLIQDLVTTPIQAVRYQKIVESGNGFTFDFINSPVNLFNGKGGTFTLADDSDYPGGIGSGMASVVLVLAPCAMIQPHYQPRANEIGYLISGGPMRWATQFEAGGPLDYEFLQVGQALMLPKGSMHYGLVLGCDPTLVLAAFEYCGGPWIQLGPLRLLGLRRRGHCRL
ncbi:hypothetical protein BT69DRAFT_517872 [Atractiella rhizophila]|nr:hypothetical protein BT69DRAFT_517872 [Atractiella rhizophila]